MAKFFCMGNYTAKAFQGFIKEPNTDRSKAAKAAEAIDRGNRCDRGHHPHAGEGTLLRRTRSDSDGHDGAEELPGRR